MPPKQNRGPSKGSTAGPASAGKKNNPGTSTPANTRADRQPKSGPEQSLTRNKSGASAASGPQTVFNPSSADTAANFQSSSTVPVSHTILAENATVIHPVSTPAAIQVELADVLSGVESICTLPVLKELQQGNPTDPICLRLNELRSALHNILGDRSLQTSPGAASSKAKAKDDDNLSPGTRFRQEFEKLDQRIVHIGDRGRDLLNKAKIWKARAQSDELLGDLNASVTMFEEACDELFKQKILVDKLVNVIPGLISASVGPVSEDVPMFDAGDATSDEAALHPPSPAADDPDPEVRAETKRIKALRETGLAEQRRLAGDRSRGFGEGSSQATVGGDQHAYAAEPESLQNRQAVEAHTPGEAEVPENVGTPTNLRGTWPRPRKVEHKRSFTDAFSDPATKRGG